MEFYNQDVDPYLEPNNEWEINHGMGFYIKEGTPKERIKIIREYHDERLKKGKPYFILDFLVEDLQNDPESVENRGVFGFYRKKKD